MNFIEKNKVVGRLEIIKVDSRTGKAEVVFDERNVITGGMGRSIAQFMTRPDCDSDPCGQKYTLKNKVLEPQEGIDYLIEDD